ncbi:MAG: hypothetical protein AB1918_05215 [Pseudomonadota bacterium]
MRRLISLLPLLVAAPALADDGCRDGAGIEPPAVAVPAVDGQFRYIPGKGLGCSVPEEEALEMARHKLPLTYLGCLRLGGVAVGEGIGEVEERLGPPDRVLRLSESTETRAYFLRQPTPVRPYFAVTYRKGDVVAVQLKGPPTADALDLSSLRLGDAQARVVELFGPPVKRCPGPKGGETWLWPPMPLGVDLADGVVTGLKVSWPAR